MLKVCDGLPLAIVALGGILRKKQSVGEWDSVHKNISSHLRMGYDHGRSCMDILLQSCYDLPFHLKPCFLHLAHFPEDHEIWTENLYWMWAAEGLVTRSSCTDRTSGSRKSLEDIANDYMNELALVGLVEIVSKTSEGWIKAIRMHDLVRDLCLEKATTEDFLKTVDLRPGQDNQQLSTSDYYSSKRLLRLSIHLPSPEDSIVDNSAITDSLSSRGHKYLRSLLFTIPYTFADYEDQCQQLMDSICNEVQMLRVLVLENMGLKGRLTTQVGNLLHLRYLSLEGTRVSEVPSSIGKLRFLEILNLKVKKELIIIPNTLWKLFRLRHLLLPSSGYEIKKQQGRNLPPLKEPKKMRVDTLISLETIENMQVEKHRTKDLLKIKNLRRISIQGRGVLIEEEMMHIISALKPSVGSCSEIKVRGDVISKNPTILLDFVCNHELEIRGRISVHLTQNVDYFSQFLVGLVLEECELEDDPMRILGSLLHLRSLDLKTKSYVGTKLSCHSNSFPLLEYIWLMDLERLEVFEAEDGSMPKLEILYLWKCTNLNGIPDVLPSSLKEISLVGSGKTPQGGVNLEGGVQIVNPYDFEEWLKDAVLKVGEYEKVILLGESGVGREPLGMKLSHNKDVNRDFDAIAMTCVPRRRSDGLIPNHILKQLLRDLKSIRPDEHYEDLSRMSSEKLIAEIQQVLQQTKCLVILEGVDLHHLDCLDALDKTFGLIERRESFQSKLVIATSTSDDDQVSAATVADHCNRLRVFKLRRPTPVETWQMLKGEDWGYWMRNAGIKWNMMRHCSGHPLSTLLLPGLLKTKENLPEWAAKHSLEKQLIGSNPHEIFSICYNDLPLHLRSCLIFLANFPEGTQIPTKKLFQMWTAAGFCISKHDGVIQTTEEHLENLASTYLTELVQRGMVTILKRGPDRRAKTCRLDFALRDMCLEKAKEERILTIVDLFKRTTSRSNANIKTQQLAVHLDQISSSTNQQESLVDFEKRNVYKRLMDRLDTVEECHCHPMSAFSLISIKFLVFFGLIMVLAWTLTLDMMKHNRFLQLMMWQWVAMFLVIALGLSVVYLMIYKYVLLFTRHLKLYLEEKGPSEQLISSFSFISSPTSLLIFPNVSDPLYNEEKWEWLLYICKHFQMLRVLDLEGMWMTKGSLPKDVGDLSQLRYLSLKGTWVSELPSSIENLSNLETLDLRVLESIILPDVLWKLSRLINLYLPDHFTIAQEIEKLRIHGMNCLQMLVNLQVEKHRTKDLLKIKNLRRLSIQGRGVLIEEEMLHIISALKSSVGSCSEIKVGGDVISKNPTILLGFVCNHELEIIGRISVHLTQNVDYFSQFLVGLVLEKCKLEDDPMRILGSLLHLRSLDLKTKLSCHSNSFPLLEDMLIRGLEKLEVFEAEHGSMPKLEMLYISRCTKLNGIPDVFPSSLKYINMYFNDINPQGCVNLEGGVQIVNPYDFQEWLKDAVLKVGEYEKVVLLGKSSAGREPLAMKLYHNKDVNRDFDAVARACVPRRRRRSDDLIPRHILKQLLIDLKPIRPGEDYEYLSRMGIEKLIAEIQQVMQQTKCLVILEGVDLHHLDCLDDLDNTFRLIGRRESFQSKLVIATSTSDDDQVSATTTTVADHCNRLRVFKLRRPTPVETWHMLYAEEYTYWHTNAGIKWNMMRHCLGHPLSTLLLAGLLKTKENLPEWAAKHSLEKQLTGSNPYEIFSICYNDLPHHLMSCLIFLANFPEGVEIPTKRLFQLWTAAGFVISKHDGVTQIEEHLENLASTYLTELVQRGMVTILKRGPDRRAKTCRLDFALRDMCLEKAKEEHILTIVDLFDHTTSRSNANIKTQQLAVHLDQISSSTDQQESLVDSEKRNVYKRLMDRLDIVEECHPMSAFSLVSIKFLIFFGLTMVLAWTLTLDMMKYNRFLQLMMWQWFIMFLVIALGLSVVYFTVYKYLVLFTRHLKPYLKKKGPNEQMISSFSFISSPTSLLIFPNVSDPLYNEEKWEWLLYICKHFQMLRVLDIGGMWMTKGSLPKDVGDLSQLRYLCLKGTWVSELPPSIKNLSNLETLDLRVLESIIIPDVLWKLSRLINLYLPDHFTIAQEIEKLRIHGMNCLQILVNLQTDTVWLIDLLLLKRLREISIRKIHAVDEFNDILIQLSKSLEVSINSEIINANPTILSSLHSLHKLKIKGAISVELRPEMFPAQLEELTLKHTKLERDPLPVLENLSNLKSLFCGHESFLGKTMTVSGVFHDRTALTLCSLSYLEKLYVPHQYKWLGSTQVVIIECWRVSTEKLPSTSNTSDEEEDTHLEPKCLDLCPLKKSFSCW